MSYGIEVGQIYRAADGVSGTYLVVDVTTYADVDDVIVYSIDRNQKHHRIDAWKLSQVRYYLDEKAYNYKPHELRTK
jgi:hypothetical protein